MELSSGRMRVSNFRIAIRNSTPTCVILGFGIPAQPMLPMIAMPTTAGSGSEERSHALISDATNARKDGLRRSESRLSRGDSGSAAPVATARCDRRRTRASIVFTREAWQLLAANFERVLRDPCDLEGRGAMLLGAY
jgi:alcohol dehydrogenase